MERRRFDNLARAVASRRSTFRLLAASLATLPFTTDAARCKPMSAVCSKDGECCAGTCVKLVPNAKCSRTKGKGKHKRTVPTGNCQCSIDGCQPDNATACSSRECGSATNNCGDTVNCGTCGGLDVCLNDGSCCSPSGQNATCGADGCGTKQDNCGQDVDCGACVGDLVCHAHLCGCPADSDRCGNRCVHFATDVQNCGSCGHACGAGERCMAGSCKALQSVLRWGSGYGTADDQFTKPKGVAVAPDGTVFVTDQETHSVRVFEADGTLIRRWGGQGSALGQFSYPLGIAVAPGGSVYVADSFNNRIQELSATGTPIRAITGLSSPADVAIAGDGTIYVADQANFRIAVFDQSGDLINSWGSLGTGQGQFRNLVSMELDADGRVYTSDDFTTVQVFRSDGEFIRRIGSHGTGVQELHSPEYAALSLDGLVYVADGSRILVFTTTGDVVSNWGSPGSGAQELNTPVALALSSDGTLYVADTFNSRIQKVQWVAQ